MKNRKGISVAVALVAIAAVLVVVYFWFDHYYTNIDFHPEPAASDNSIKKFASYAELEDFVRENSGTYYSDISLRTMATLGAVAKGGAVTESGADQATTYSGTNIQVEGVDEADIVKTDGKYIYAVAGGNRKVVIVDAYPAETASNVSEIDFDGEVNELFVNGNRLVVFWQENVRVPQPSTGTASGAAEVLPTSEASEKKMVAEPSPQLSPPQYHRYSQKTHVDVYDISDRNAPLLASNSSVDGNYFGSRMIDGVVYVIATQPAYYVKGEPIPVPAIQSSSAAAVNAQSGKFPDVYYFDVPDDYYAFTSIVSVNVNDGTVSGKMLLTGATQNLYVSANNIYVAYSKYLGNLQGSDIFIDRVVLPLFPENVKGEINRIREDSNLTRSERWSEIEQLLENYSKTLSESERQRIELAAKQKMSELENELSKEREKTVIQKLSISEGKVEYKTNGVVPGTILNQFSMDEHNGYFRIATTTSMSGFGGMVTGSQTRVAIQEQMKTVSEPLAKSSTESQGQAEVQTKPMADVDPNVVPSQQPAGPLNHVYVLDENLKIVGKLEDLAPGERIYSVRFMGDKAYMVTFRQVDPLFVIDLTNPASPNVLGFLKIPGVSDYLHPYDDTHVIGVGRDASEGGRILGMKLSLFDVTNVSAPREISKYVIGGRGTSSEALSDHKAFLFSMEKSLLVIPVSEWHEFLGGQEMGGPWISYYSQGAYVFNLDLTNGFTLKGKISHMGNETSDDWDATVRRSLFIDNVLYTLSNKKVEMNRLADLSELNEVPLPQPTYETPVYLIEEAVPVGTAVR